MKHVKMYKVEFNHYFNDTDRNTVDTCYYDEYHNYVGEDGKEPKLDNIHYLYIPNIFIIREDEIEKYKKFGCGYKSLEYVGSIIEE